MQKFILFQKYLHAQFNDGKTAKIIEEKELERNEIAGQRASFFTMRKVGRARPPLRRPTTGISPLQV